MTADVVHSRDKVWLATGTPVVIQGIQRKVGDIYAENGKYFRIFLDGNPSPLASVSVEEQDKAWTDYQSYLSSKKVKSWKPSRESVAISILAMIIIVSMGMTVGKII